MNQRCNAGSSSQAPRHRPGQSFSLDGQGRWRPSYLFQYANAGWISVFRINADGTVTTIRGWTRVPGVIWASGGYNLVEIWAADDTFSWAVNYEHVGDFGDGGPTTGSVGVSTYTEPGTWSETWIDSALLNEINTRPAHRKRGAVGNAVTGGTIDMAPG